jgi:hypothetical protein
MIHKAPSLLIPERHKAMFRTCTSYADQSACVADLANACVLLEKQLALSEPDARRVALTNLADIARAGQLVLNFLDSWAKGDNTVRTVIPQLIGLTIVTPASVEHAGSILKKSAKLSLALLGQFQIENVLQNVARELGLTKSKGFYGAASAVLKELGLPEHLDSLNVAARSRNSLHSNGIHHAHPGEKPLIILKGVSYEFKNGEKVNCADWQHIAHTLECSVDILRLVFLHPRVAAIPDPMMDQYAWEVVTAPN